ncbi:MAG: cell division protein FtsQ/DivIB, partial [Nocardioidaceae bacterium]|nr:cell division protein FtsQ/DivIB [Nocardioidaceae bacterium]
FAAPPKARKGLPVVRIGASADKDALREGAAVVAALEPDVRALVAFLQVRTVDDILLHLRDGRLVRWGSAENSEDKAAVLLDLLDRKAQVYNVAVPSQPTTR